MRRIALALILPVLVAAGCSSCGAGTAEQKYNASVPVAEAAAACVAGVLAGHPHDRTSELVAFAECAVQAILSERAALAALKPDAAPPSSSTTDAAGK